MSARTRPGEVFLDEVGVDGDCGGGTGTRRRDHLGTRVDDVPGGPNAGCAGPPVAIDGDKARGVAFAAQGGGDAVGAWNVVGADEHCGVMRWHLRVVSYAFALATDEYPPFRLAA